jgi:hypothetical protein
MPSTYTLISSNVLGLNAASVTFSSIPSTYTDLAIRISARITTTDVDDLLMQFNSLTTYSYTQIRGYNGTNVASSRATAASRIRVSEVNGAASTSNTYTSTEIYIPNYNASASHPTSSFGAVEENGSTYNKINATAGLYSATSVPITSITFSLNGAYNFLSTSSFYLYGIKNS